jgi:hypothetical protein
MEAGLTDHLWTIGELIRHVIPEGEAAKVSWQKRALEPWRWGRWLSIGRPDYREHLGAHNHARFIEVHYESAKPVPTSISPEPTGPYLTPARMFLVRRTENFFNLLQRHAWLYGHTLILEGQILAPRPDRDDRADEQHRGQAHQQDDYDRNPPPMALKERRHCVILARPVRFPG